MQTLPKLPECDSEGVRWYRDDTLNELARVNGGRLFGESTMLTMLANGGLREYWTLPTPPLSDVSSPRGGPMGRRNLLPDLEAFLDAYIEAALWSSTGDDGSPLDDDHDADDIAPATLASMRSDCEAFIAANQADLVACGLSAARAGHNYWLNRNRHGSGFWDEVSGGHPLRDTFNRLSDASKADGTVDLYLGDDGKIYA